MHYYEKLRSNCTKKPSSMDDRNTNNIIEIIILINLLKVKEKKQQRAYSFKGNFNRYFRGHFPQQENDESTTNKHRYFQLH